MTINLLKHKNELMDAFNFVLESIDSNWALFSYDGNSNTLKTEATGESGLDELRQNLDTGKIMYGLIKIKDPSSSLSKLMLIHWQGECVPSMKLSPCASHIHEVKKFFKGIHLTHYARCDEDVDSDSINKAIGKVNYGLNTIVPADVSKEPLSATSVYERPNVQKDIDVVERDKFWSTAEKEEAKRLEEDRRRALLEKQRLEEEKQRLQENLIRESQNNVPDRRMNVVDSEIMRRERLQEVNKVISSKSGLKSMWEEKTSVKPTQPVKSDLKTKPVAVKTAWPSLPARETFEATNVDTSPIKADDKVTETKLQSVNVKHSTPVKEDTTIRQTVNDFEDLTKEHDYQPDNDQDIDKEWESVDYVENTAESEPFTRIRTRETPAVNQTDVGISAQAIWDYQAADDTEISFNPGDIITHIERIDEGWWRGRAPDGLVGLFPANYVELLT